MKTLFALLVTAFSFSVAKAQENPFLNSTYKIEPAAAEGHFTLRKAKRLKLPEEQAKFHYIQFDNDRNFATGNDCYGMNGNYDEEGEQQIRFKEGVAGMASDCVEPKSLIGTYAYEVFSDRIELRPIYDATEATSEVVDYESADVVDAAQEAEVEETVKQAAKDIEAGATPKKRKRKR